MTSHDQVRDQLGEIVDPCTAATGSNLDIVEMGLVKSITIDDGTVTVEIRLTTPACHMVPYFIEAIEERVSPLPDVDAVTVDTDNGLHWTPDMMTDTARDRRKAVLERYESRLQNESVSAE